MKERMRKRGRLNGKMNKGLLEATTKGKRRRRRRRRGGMVKDNRGGCGGSREGGEKRTGRLGGVRGEQVEG